MFCKKCGARIDDDSVFCDSCGERVVRRSGGAIERSYQAQPAAVPATDKQRLIEYLEIVVDLEKNRYIQEQTINQLDAEINSLGNRRNITRRFADVQGNAERAERKIDLFGVGGFLGFGAAALIFFTGLSSYTSFGNFILRTIIAIVVGFALYIFPQAIGEAIARSSSKSQSADEQARYDAQYEAAVASDNIRVSRELVKKQTLIEQRDLLSSQLEKTKHTLKRFYDTNILYGKYHNNFVAVASFIDYFKSGMCSTLEERYGRDGAYNTFEELCRLDKIIYKLDQVLTHLEQIKENQWTIYNAIMEGNNLTASLVDSTNRLVAASEQAALNSSIVAENSAITAYNTRQAASELNQIKWLELYKM